MTRGYYRVGRVRIYGAPVFVHWTALLAGCILAALWWREPAHAAIAAVSYFAIIVFHELGHAVVANKLGCAVHSIKIGFMHGWCMTDAPSSEWDEVLVAWAGVLVQCVVAIPLLIVARIFDNLNDGFSGPVIVFLGYMNLMIALTNLAPTTGFDGKTAWRIIPLVRERRKARVAAARVISRVQRKK